MSRIEPQNEVQNMLKRIFIQYASPNKQSLNIRLKKYIDLMQDSGIIDRHLTVKQIELIFCGENKHRANMNFDTFLETLPRIIAEKFPTIYKNSPGEALAKLLQNHFWPLYQRMNEDNRNELPEVDDECINIIHSAFNGFRTLYGSLFPWELRKDLETDMVMNRSQRTFHNFVKEFDICPTLLTKNQVLQIWNDIILVHSDQILPAVELLPDPNLEQGQILTLSKFIFIIYLIAEKGYEQDANLEQSPPSEKLLVLLERLELSKGFVELSGSVRNITILPSQEVIHQVLYPETEDIDEFSHITEEEEEKSADAETYGLDVNSQTVAKLEEYFDKLQHIFQAYCSFGEPMNTSKMSGSKLVKLMRDVGILKITKADIANMSIRSSQSIKSDGLLTKVDIDIIFTRVSDKRINNGRLDFKQFLKAIEQVAHRAFPNENLDNAFLHVVSEYIMKLENDWNDERGVNSGYIRNLMEMLREPDVIETLNLVHKSIIYFYRFYSNSLGLMNFENFLRFTRDFAIFPDLIAKSKLHRFFHTLAGIHAQTEQPEMSVSRSSYYELKNDASEDVIDEHLFVESLALVAAEVLYKEPEPTPVERICFLMERMSQSEGLSKVLIENGHNRASAGECKDILVFLKARYPEIFSYGSEQKLGFGDILADMNQQEMGSID
ncbi:unnamed protein product [Blepharisma stoltei]|uniref:Uncharacterized protein n=1 Tax=Blepharisma stoltei TaxID=1481888 RepID=A0AAU9JVG6_9CILI|nr:unnamed protein product [Blepharisma stoltei]